jgi:hypothetical protein
MLFRKTDAPYVGGMTTTFKWTIATKVDSFEVCSVGLAM